MSELEKIDGSATLPHLRRLRKYLDEIQAQRFGAGKVDCAARAARCQQDARLTDDPQIRRVYRRLSKLFEQAACLP